MHNDVQVLGTYSIKYLCGSGLYSAVVCLDIAGDQLITCIFTLALQRSRNMAAWQKFLYDIGPEFRLKFLQSEL